MGCHQHENVHQKQYTNERCLECHKMAGIVETKPRAINEFHGPNSRFPLTEGHKGVACDKCHPGNVFKETRRCSAGRRAIPTSCTRARSARTARAATPAASGRRGSSITTPRPSGRSSATTRTCCARAATRGAISPTTAARATPATTATRRTTRTRGALGAALRELPLADGAGQLRPQRSRGLATGRSRASTARSSAPTAISRSTSSRRRASAAAATASPTCIAGSSARCAASCHVADDWKIVHTGHDVPTPRFGGAHDRVACVSCHPGGRAARRHGQPVHHVPSQRRHPPQRARAATAGSATRSARGRAAHFKHNRVGCELIGVHRMLPCVDCHVGGNFTALATNCVACHAQGRGARHRYRSPTRRARCRRRTHSGFDTCAELP